MTLEQELFRLAESNLEEFSVAFRRVRTIHPEEAACACFRYFAKYGCNELWRKAQFWILANNHVELLFAPDVLTDDEAVRVGVMLRDVDPQFLSKLKTQIDKAISSLNPQQLGRIVRLYGGLGNSDFLLSWLRTLSSHPNEKIRSMASKELCILRPNRLSVERQLKSEDSRVRANAIEALWAVNDPEMVPLVRSCLKDPAPRVVVNAAIALFRMKVPGALAELIKCGESAAPMMRRAAIWGMQKVADPSAIPALRKLAADPVPEISFKGLTALLALGGNLAEEESTPQTPSHESGSVASTTPAAGVSDEKSSMESPDESSASNRHPLSGKEESGPESPVWRKKSDILGI